MKEKNRTWGKWYLKGLAFLATGIFTSMAAGLSVMAQTELTFTEKLTIEEVRELSEPEKDYEDENGIRYELKHWELQEKEGEEITRTLEKRVEYPKVEAAEEVPEIILADETDPGWILLSGNLYRKNVEITGKQWKEDFSVPVTFYSYGADEYELGDLVIPAGEDQLLEKTAEAGDRILEDLGLSKDDYRITSLVWNGEPFSDENGHRLSGNEELVRRMAREGHQIGVHTFDHVPVTGLSHQEFDLQVGGVRAQLRDILGDGEFWLRPPYGHHSSAQQGQRTGPAQ